jgi:hypothetical protein
MGDRRVAEIKTEDGSLFFYTHWAGYNLVEHAELALDDASGRRGDDGYALKIVLDSLIKRVDGRDTEYNAGIYLQAYNEDHEFILEDEYGDGNSPSIIIDLRQDRWEAYDLTKVADTYTYHNLNR